MGQDNPLNRFNQGGKQCGTPGFASAQRDTILRLLREAKLRGEGVSRADLIFQHRYTQCGTRIFELEHLGYVIEHRSIPGQRFVTYFLISEPERLKPLPTYLPKGPDKRQGSLADSPDWYERATGRPRSGWQSRPFSEKRMAQDDCFVLTPPEHRP